MKNRIFCLFLIITLVLTAYDQKLRDKSTLTSNIRVDLSEASLENFKRLSVVDTILLIALTEDIKNDLVLGQLDKIIILNSTIYIADIYLKRLLMYDIQGDILGGVGNLGGSPGEFASLSDFCVEKDGGIYTYDSMNNKVLVYGKESNFLRDYPLSFKAERFQAAKDGLLFRSAPYNQDDMALDEQIAHTDNEFALLAAALEYDKNTDNNCEFLSPMIPIGNDIIYNRIINNNTYILGSRSESKQILRLDFGGYNIVTEGLKDINALLDPDKDYCYIAYPSAMIDSMIMGVLNKKGELYTLIYDQKRNETALNGLADFSYRNISLPITLIGSNFLVSCFNKDMYSSYSQSGELNFELKGKIDQGVFVSCLNKIGGGVQEAFYLFIMVMCEIVSYIISILTVFASCTSTDIPDRASLQPQVMSDSLLTTMSGNLLLVDDYLVWSDPFSDNKFLHVHHSSNGKYIGSMGQRGEGPQEFVSLLINRFSINHYIVAHDANGKTRGYLSIDGLVTRKEPSMSLSGFDRNIRMAKLDRQLYLIEAENGENDCFKMSSNEKESTFGVHPVREVRQHMGTYKTYDKDRGLLAPDPFSSSYLALYKEGGDNFKLLQEHISEKENYSVADGAIRFDHNMVGVRNMCMTKEYIITLEHDQKVDSLDERTVGHNTSRCPHTVSVYGCNGKLPKIVDLGMPIMRIAADGRSGALYAIGINPDPALAKYNLQKLAWGRWDSSCIFCLI